VTSDVPVPDNEPQQSIKTQSVHACKHTLTLHTQLQWQAGGRLSVQDGGQTKKIYCHCITSMNANEHTKHQALLDGKLQ